MNSRPHDPFSPHVAPAKNPSHAEESKPKTAPKKRRTRKGPSQAEVDAAIERARNQ